jgi:superfamily II DNA/RNA helicase
VYDSQKLIKVVKKVLANISFISLGISPSLVATLERANITNPSPIQTEAILENRDIKPQAVFGGVSIFQ